MSLSKTTIRNIRCPRSSLKLLAHLPSSIYQHLDTAQKAKKEDLSEWLWEENLPEANKALNTGFIQGIKSGLLDPTDYGELIPVQIPGLPEPATRGLTQGIYYFKENEQPQEFSL